jgi:hypothetical protein
MVNLASDCPGTNRSQLSPICNHRFLQVASQSKLVKDCKWNDGGATLGLGDRVVGSFEVTRWRKGGLRIEI